MCVCVVNRIGKSLFIFFGHLHPIHILILSFSIRPRFLPTETKKSRWPFVDLWSTVIIPTLTLEFILFRSSFLLTFKSSNDKQKYFHFANRLFCKFSVYLGDADAHFSSCRALLQSPFSFHCNSNSSPIYILSYKTRIYWTIPDSAWGSGVDV